MGAGRDEAELMSHNHKMLALGFLVALGALFVFNLLAGRNSMTTGRLPINAWFWPTA
jgi:hypothetical protein